MYEKVVNQLDIGCISSWQQYKYSLHINWGRKALRKVGKLYCATWMKLEKLVWEWHQSHHKLCIRVNITGQIRFLQSLCQRNMVQEEATVMEEDRRLKEKQWDCEMVTPTMTWVQRLEVSNSPVVSISKQKPQTVACSSDLLFVF